MPVTHDQFHGQLDQGKLELAMDDHFPSVDEARKPVEAFLKAWEVRAHLGGHKIGFTFHDSVIIDRNPDPSQARIINGSAVFHCTTSMGGTLVVHPVAYPEPPTWKNCSNMVCRMYDRFAAYQEQRESIYSAGYYCLTELLENAAGTVERGGRIKVASKFNIDIEVLKKLGELTSTRGDPLSARKAGTVPATPTETVWLREAIPRIIRHVAGVEAGDVGAALTMAELPIL